MDKISAVIITLNEERNIQRCLESLMPIADEVVVVDSCSTDATQELCSIYPVRFFSHPWEGYAATKNYANSLASNDLIFSIDADEAVSSELAQSILNIKGQDIRKKAFSMNRRMNYCGQWIKRCGWYPDTKVRIFDRRDSFWSGKIHETLKLPDGTQTVHLKGDLLHYSFYTPEEHRKQTERFAMLSAEEAVEKGKTSNCFSACLHTGWKFLRDYLCKGGVLEGADGLAICKTNAYGVWYKYKKIMELSRS